MSDITLSASVRSNLLSLQNTASLLDTTQTRLATGNKVNSALDNPTNYFTASGLNARASDLGNLLDGVSNAIQTIQAANDGITSITKLVESAQATANQAQQTSETVALAANVAGSVSLTDPTGTVAAVENGNVDVRDVAGANATAVSDGVDFSNDTKATTSGVTDLSSGLGSISQGQGIDITIGGVTKTFKFDDGTGIDTSTTFYVAASGDGSDLISKINTAFGAGTASLDSSDHFLVLTAGNTDDSITVADNSGSTSGAKAALGGLADAAPTSSVIAGLSGDLSIKVGSTDHAVDLTGVDNQDDFLAAVNSALSTAGTASFDEDGNLKIVAANAADSITVSGDDTATVGLETTAYDPADATNAVATGVAAKSLTITVGTDAKTIDLSDATDQDSLLSAINDGLDGAATATIDSATGHLKITAANNTDSITASGTAAGDLGLSTTAVGPGAATNTTIIGTQAKTLSIKVGTTDHTVDLTAVTDQDSLLAAINTGLNGSATASYGTDGKLNLTAANTTDSITVSGTAAGDLGLSTSVANPNANGANPARAALISQYNGLLDQIDQLTADASYNGNNLLGGTSAQLKVVFNENGSSSLTVTGKDASAAGLGLTKLGATDFDTNASITGILSKLKVATDTLRTDASSFGSNLSIVQARQDFTKSLINTLQTGASNLTLADSNEEAANLLALQTRQSLSTKALSLASQSDQNVLRLLQ